MNSKKIINRFVFAIILFANIGCDQVSKNIARTHLQDNEQIGFLNNYFTLIKIENSGAFLSMGDQLSKPMRILFLTILPAIILGLTLLMMLRSKNLSNLAIIAICFVTGGGIGNIYDRILYGSVTDFMHIDFGFFQTGIFNMADVSIMVGAFMLLLDAYLKEKRDKSLTVSGE